MAKTITLADLRSKSDGDLETFIKTASKDLLEARFQNYTNQLNDTSRMGKLRRDLARALTVKSERAKGAAAKG